MKPVKVMIGFVPFLAFSLLIGVLGVGWAAAAALGTAVVVVMATGLDGIKSVPMALAVILLVMEFAGFCGGPPVDDVLVRYGPAITALLLGLFIIGTATTAPFTAQFACREVPPELRDSRGFLEMNRRVSTAWGLAVLVLGLCHVLGAQIDPDGVPPVLRLVVSWAPPLVAFWQVAGFSGRALATVRLNQAHRAGEVTA